MERLINKLLDLRIFRSFRVKTTPRWIILLLDMLIVLASFIATVVADMYSQHTVLPSQMILLNAFIVVAVYYVVSYVSKSYTCVIRLSVIEDLYRIFMVIVIATVVLVVINVLKLAMTGIPFMKFWDILIIAAFSFSLMMIERLCIKYIYMRMNAATEGRQRVLVLGTSFSSLFLANALKGEVGGKYLPVGLLSIKSKPENSEINGFKIYRFDPTRMTDLFAENHIDALIFDAKSMNLMSSGFADFFIKNDIPLLSMNKVAEFEQDSGKEQKNISTYIQGVQIEDLLGRDPIVLSNPLVKENINGSCVLITGACGSIGSEIVRQVVTYGASRIVLYDQAETPMHDISLEMRKNYPDAQIELFIGDVRNRERLEEAFKEFKPRFVFHAAAYKHVPMMEINPSEAILANVMGTRNVADLALKYGVYKFVMISTDKAVNPTNIMGCTKRLAEIYCQSLFFDASKNNRGNTQFITTRFGNVLGSNGSVIPLFRKQIAEGGPVTVTHKDIIRYFMTIPEACSLVLEAGCMGKGGEIYIFDMGEPVKIYDLARRMISLAGLKPDVDIKIKEIGLRPGEKLYEELLNDKEKTTATVNKKIMIAKVRIYDYQEVCAKIDNIINLASAGQIHDMVYAMKEFVPEYKSQQSRFESIDKEIADASPLANPSAFQPTAE